MKKSLFSIAFLALLATGCTSDDILGTKPEVYNELQPLSVKAVVSLSTSSIPGTRAIIYGTAFPNNSQIGVHVAKGIVGDGDNAGAPGTPYSTNYFTNQMFHLKGAVWAPNNAYNLSADKGTVYAYYPFDDTARFTTPSSATISVVVQPSASITVKDGSSATGGINNSDAIQVPADGEKDYMYYKPAGRRAEVFNRNPEVQLTMEHALAQVSFRIINSGTYPGIGNFTKYEIYDNASKGLIITSSTSSIMSIVDGTITHTAPVSGKISRNITSYTSGAVSEQATIVSNLVFPVASIAENDITVNFYVDGQEHPVQLPVTANVSDKWEAGKNYLYTVQLGGIGIEVTDVSIADWNNVTAGDISIQ